ncbi:HD domain-containing protein [Rhodocyclus tenuis]|uniref:HD domain-containing phosphohydrolase n=1 Tax=Rhodocyclus gracilis TaxID=2929842 RepID=UPI001298AC7B|nr:HD domain-containing phosphohydrolase [Rhodocyclus gracilis]MRD74160.1 HD domain-containing protein [Rhodocyclus gracilis]
MDLPPLNTAPVADREALLEFVEALDDQAPRIERDVARLKAAPGDREAIADIFRAVHNIKGDAAMCKVDLAVAIAHPIETTLARLRGGEIVFSEVLAEAVLLAVDRLELAAATLANGKSLDPLRLPALVGGLERLAHADASAIDHEAGALIEGVTSFRASATLSNLRGRAAAPEKSVPSPAADDLRFFRELALRFESRSALFKGRTSRLLRLARETNQVAGTLVDPLQLEAAVCLHDVGMMFLPESAWLKVGHLTDGEMRELRAHPDLAHGLLSRMKGWDAAAEIVVQHHEQPDGSGYPRGLVAAAICPGAKLLAIIDAFESIMLKHIHRGRNRSVLRAIAEVNACERQFAPEWIAPFNLVIRRAIET